MNSNKFPHSDEPSPWQYPWGFLKIYPEPLRDAIGRACVQVGRPIPQLDGMSVKEMLLWVLDYGDPALPIAVWRSILNDSGMEVQEN